MHGCAVNKDLSYPAPTFKNIGKTQSNNKHNPNHDIKPIWTSRVRHIIHPKICPVNPSNQRQRQKNSRNNRQNPDYVISRHGLNINQNIPNITHLFTMSINNLHQLNRPIIQITKTRKIHTRHQRKLPPRNPTHNLPKRTQTLPKHHQLLPNLKRAHPQTESRRF